jgi:hypothetical protein
MALPFQLVADGCFSMRGRETAAAQLAMALVFC